MTKEQVDILIQDEEIGCVYEGIGSNLNNGSMTFV
jgi:hypothetical protein